MQYRYQYKNLVHKHNPHGFTFNLGEEELSVTRGKDRSQLRLVAEDGQNCTHYLIADSNKVVSNLSKAKPMQLPQELKFMTNEQLDNCGIYKYINIAEIELKNLCEHLDAYQPIYRHKNTPKTNNSFMPPGIILTPTSKEPAMAKCNQNSEKVFSELTKNIHQPHLEIPTKTNTDELTELYFKTLTEEFMRKLDYKFNEFKTKLEETLKQKLQ